MRNSSGIIFHLVVFITQLKWIFAGYLEDNFPQSVLEDAQLNTLQLLAKYKHPGEAHEVITEDKYILNMHRIPRPGAKPVLLVHGLEDSSATWILMGPQSGLGYYLYANGYDVWMANVRGNRYSRGHVKYNASTDRAYWTFSWHEIGYYDLPAMIDAVLTKTGYQKLSYFGHSQGTTSFFVMASLRPEYNDKVHLMSALAPVVFMTHMKAPLLSIARISLSLLGERTNELLANGGMLQGSCTRSSAMLKTCLHYYFQIVGKNREELNVTMFPAVMGHVPAGCNFKQPEHYIQLHGSQRFCQYDFEAKENQRVYGRATPPDYPLEKVTAPIALYYCQNDYLSAVEDVQRLVKVLPNVVENNLYPYKKWNHMDMLWGISARRAAQPKMLQVMQLWENGGPTNAKEELTTTTEMDPSNQEEQINERDLPKDSDEVVDDSEVNPTEPLLSVVQ